MLKIEKQSRGIVCVFMEVLAGIEPAMAELQSAALAPWLQNRLEQPIISFQGLKGNETNDSDESVKQRVHWIKT